MELSTAGPDGQAPGPIDSDEYACNAPCGDRVLNSAPSANKVRVHSVGADGKKPSGEAGQGRWGAGTGQGWQGARVRVVRRWRDGSVAGWGRGGARADRGAWCGVVWGQMPGWGNGQLVKRPAFGSH